MKVVIPLGHTSKNNDLELRYCLRSLGDVDLYVLGEYRPSWLQNVTFFPVGRWYPERILDEYHGVKHYENYFDVLHKLLITSLMMEDEFLWCYDDVVMLKEDFRLCAFRQSEKGFKNRAKIKWGRTINRSLLLLAGTGKHDYVYETHVPRIMNADKLAFMFDEFKIDSDRIPYAPSTLYYNYFEHEPDVILNDNNIKAGFYGQANMDSSEAFLYEDIERATEGKSWISYNDEGFTGHMRAFLECKFPKKSKFEK